MSSGAACRGRPRSPGARSLGLGAGQVDLVDDRDDLELVLERQVGVGDGLRLDALRGVHHQERALAGGQASATPRS